MSSSGAVRLSAMDVFHLRLDQELRRRGLAGNRCSLVAELEGRLDEERLRRRVAAACRAMPELGWRLGRDLRLQPVWRPGTTCAAVPVEVRQLGSDESPLAAAAAWLDEVPSGRGPWQVGVLRGPRADAVVLRWYHPLADARGGQRLFGWLGQEGGAPPAAAERFVSVDERVGALDRGRRWELLRSYRDHVLDIAAGRIASLDAATGRRRPGRTRAVRLRLSRAATADFDGQVRGGAGATENGLLAHAAARALQAALADHDVRPAQHTVVVPISLDAPRHSQRMFGNNLTMMMLRAEPDELTDRPRALASFAAQRRDIVRRRLDLAFLVALDTARYMPAPIYGWFSKRPFGGERMSILVTHPGEWALERFLGVPVTDAYPLPSVALPPGLQLVGSRHGGRLSLCLSFVDSVLSCERATELVEGLPRDLLGP